MAGSDFRTRVVCEWEPCSKWPVLGANLKQVSRVLSVWFGEGYANTVRRKRPSGCGSGILPSIALEALRDSQTRLPEQGSSNPT